MQRRNLVPALLLGGLFALLSTASNAQQAIGSTTSVTPQAEGSRGGTLAVGSSVYSKETLRTGNSGRTDLQFKDNSRMKVGPNSSLRLDRFVYDPNRSTGSVAIQATRGTFRFVTGSQDRKVYRVKTPYGTLGIRG
jgi:hypothetical protein